MELKEALGVQINFCIANPGYRSGIFVKNGQKRKVVIDCIKDFEPVLNDVASRIVVGSYNCLVEFKNGSHIRVIVASENCKAQRHNGAIIDNDIDNQTLNCVLLPLLIPMRNYELEQFEPWENVKKRVFYVWIE